MSDVKCTIPTDMLRYTASALGELAIRQRIEAIRYPAIDGKVFPDAARLLKQSVATQEAADFYSDLYMQRSKDKEADS